MAIKSNRSTYPFSASMVMMFASAFMFITVGAFAQYWNFEIGTIIVEYGFVLFPVLIIGALGRVDMKRALRLNGISLMTAVKSFFAAACLIPTIIFLNMITIIIMTGLGQYVEQSVPLPETALSFIVMIFIVSITPGICEEMMFRGMVMSAFEGKAGKYYAVIFSALLFGLFHFNPQNVIGPIVLGLVFGYLVMATNSILTSVIAHMANNGIAIAMSFLGNSTSSQNAQGAGKVFAEIVRNPAELTAMIVGLAIFALVFLVPAILLIRSIKLENAKIEVGGILAFEDAKFDIVDKRHGTLYFKPAHPGSRFAEDSTYTIPESEMKQNGLVNMTPVFSKSDRRLRSRSALIPLIAFFFLYTSYIALAILGS